MAATATAGRDEARGDTDGPDIAMALTLPETTPSWQSPAPDGCSTLADLESLYAQAVQNTSDHDFDVWFKQRVSEIHKIDFSEPLPGTPPQLLINAVK